MQECWQNAELMDKPPVTRCIGKAVWLTMRSAIEGITYLDVSTPKACFGGVLARFFISITAYEIAGLPDEDTSHLYTLSINSRIMHTRLVDLATMLWDIFPYLKDKENTKVDIAIYKACQVPCQVCDQLPHCLSLLCSKCGQRPARHHVRCCHHAGQTPSFFGTPATFILTTVKQQILRQAMPERQFQNVCDRVPTGNVAFTPAKQQRQLWLFQQGLLHYDPVE